MYRKQHKKQKTGWCKNLLQEYALKKNYAIPSYSCQIDESQSGWTLISCTVDVGGMKYIGAAAKTKKEVEIEAATTALLPIQSRRCSKKGTDKPKKGLLKEKPHRKGRDGKGEPGGRRVGFPSGFDRKQLFFHGSRVREKNLGLWMA